MTNQLRFDRRVALITGAGGGLGRAYALLLAARGASVVVNDLGGSMHGEGAGTTAADRVVTEIQAAGGEAIANYDSVDTWEGGEKMIAAAVDEFGKVDIVVNNAGILRDKSFAKMDASLIDPVIDVHLRGAFYVTQPAWGVMKEKNYGRIINTSSNSGLLGNFGQANYGAAKMGLVGFTRVLANEGKKSNIKANAIAPVAMTRMTEELLGGFGEELDPALVTPVVVYLAHESCPVSGEVYSAAGGVVARFFIGLTEGYYNPQLTAEDVRDHFDQIRDEEGYIVPDDPSGELGKLLKILSS